MGIRGDGWDGGRNSPRVPPTPIWDEPNTSCGGWAQSATRTEFWIQGPVLTCTSLRPWQCSDWLVLGAYLTFPHLQALAQTVSFLFLAHLENSILPTWFNPPTSLLKPSPLYAPSQSSHQSPYLLAALFMCLPLPFLCGLPESKKPASFLTGSQDSRAGPNAYQAQLKNGREHDTTSDAYRAWKTRGDASFSSIPGLNGFSHVAPEWPESREALPVETTVWCRNLPSTAFLGPGPRSLETASVLFKLQNRAHGQLRPSLGGGSMEQGHAGASLLQPPGPQGSKYTVLSQLLLAVVEESKGVQVCGNLSLYVYVSALTWRLGFVLSRGWILRGLDCRLSVRTNREAPLIPTISPNATLLSRKAS